MSQTDVIRVARCQEAVYIQVVGHGDMNNSETFKAFAEEMAETGCRCFVVDLRKCTGVDSTFMGTMLGVHLALQQSSEGLLVINPDNHTRKQMASVGLDKLMRMKEDPTRVPRIAMHVLPSVETSPVTHLKHMLRAHQTLVDIDPRNARKFGAFLKALSAEFDAMGGDT